MLNDTTRRLLALAAVALLAHSAGARSFLDNIPGSGLVGDLYRELSNTFDESFRALTNQLEPELEGCLDDLVGCSPPRDPDAKRNVRQIIESRGFLAEEHDVTTRDGYILTVQRIVNPLVAQADRLKLKPVILQHGLMSSSVDWVVNSVDVRPAAPPPPPRWARRNRRTLAGARDDHADNSIEGHQQRDPSARPELVGDTQQSPNSLGFYLANQGYDVFLANSRGNVYGQRHARLSSWEPAFWDFTFDEQIKYDLPDTIEFVQRLTNQTKLGYVGHSQGTTMIFGLLSERPEFADVVEPVVALAPVAYVDHCLSPVRHFARYAPVFQHIDMWFATSNAVVRYLAPKVCTPEVIRKDICANIVFLSCGFDEDQFNMTRVSAYLSHMPSGTSVKNIAHWGQMVNSGRFAHFDHGLLANQLVYGKPRPPDYQLERIRSKSISLFTADNDWLASPLDVAHLKASLRVPVFKHVNVSEVVPKWNHIDFVYGKDAGQLVNTKIIDIFEHFRQ